MILTSVPNVYLNFGTEQQKPIEKMNVQQAREAIEDGQFGATNMLPKINAAITYLSACPQGRVIITSADRAIDALSGKAGTVITA